MTLFGIDPSDGAILREHELEALDAAGHDLDGLELYFEDDQSGELYAADAAGEFTPIDAADLLTQLSEDQQGLFHTFHSTASFPDAADQLGSYMEQTAAHAANEHAREAEITEDVLYEDWRDDQLEEAARHENLAQPRDFEDAFQQSVDEGLIGGKSRRAPAKPTGDGLTDEMNAFAEQLSDRHAVQQAARAAVRAAARAQAEGSS